MKSRRDLKREYLERRKPAGVYQVRNNENGKVFLGSSLNLEGSLNRHLFSLKAGLHDNKALQQDWKSFGESAFSMEILEEVKVTDDPGFNVADELEILEMIWVEKLEPFGEKGYNKSPKIRLA